MPAGAVTAFGGSSAGTTTLAAPKKAKAKRHRKRSAWSKFTSQAKDALAIPEVGGAIATAVGSTFGSDAGDYAAKIAASYRDAGPEAASDVGPPPTAFLPAMEPVQAPAAAEAGGDGGEEPFWKKPGVLVAVAVVVVVLVVLSRKK